MNNAFGCNMRDGNGIVHLPHPVMGNAISKARSWWLACCNMQVRSGNEGGESTDGVATCLICVGSATGRYLEAKRTTDEREP